MIELPEAFRRRMQELLTDEADLFFQTYEAPKTMGLRVNTLKISVKEFLDLGIFDLQPVAWAPQGFYYSEGQAPGKHLYHTAGLYYIQEPSAMAVAPALDAKPGERVLDLCAAPGGKSTHLASYMQGQGILVANEFSAGRAKILAENLERLGVPNSVIFNETPARLASVFPAYFDRILVDAPCSGEGMFRKDPDACNEWSPENVATCALRQQDILAAAAKMLRPGGKLVYSTCTFAPDENEAVITQFLDSYPEFEILPFPNSQFFSAAMPEWGGSNEHIRHAVRLWPHRLQGEGHFAALLVKKDGDEKKFKPFAPKASSDAVSLYKEFVRDNLRSEPANGPFHLQGDNLYLLPAALPDISRLKWVRPGLHLGEVKKKRFEPSHTLAMTLQQNDAKRVLELSPDDPLIHSYLRGETIPVQTENGWTLVCVGRFPLGWGKTVQGILKNHYPKGLRQP